jgi:hypothetical protein
MRQALLITNDATVVTPTNLAIALNEGCIDCQTLADAVQVVASTNGPVRFTAAGIEEVVDIRRDLRALRRSGLPIAEIEQRLDVLAQRFVDVLANELIVVRPAQA